MSTSVAHLIIFCAKSHSNERTERRKVFTKCWHPPQMILFSHLFSAFSLLNKLYKNIVDVPITINSNIDMKMNENKF